MSQEEIVQCLLKDCLNATEEVCHTAIQSAVTKLAVLADKDLTVKEVSTQLCQQLIKLSNGEHVETSKSIFKLLVDSAKMEQIVNTANTERTVKKVEPEVKVQDAQLQQLYDEMKKAELTCKQVMQENYNAMRDCETQLKNAIIAFENYKNADKADKCQQQIAILNETLAKLTPDTASYKSIKNAIEAEENNILKQCNINSYEFYVYVRDFVNKMDYPAKWVSLTEYRKTDEYKQNYARFEEVIVKHCVSDSIQRDQEGKLQSFVLKGTASDVYKSLRDAIKKADHILYNYLYNVSGACQSHYNTLLAYFGFQLTNGNTLTVTKLSDEYQRYYRRGNESYTYDSQYAIKVY